MKSLIKKRIYRISAIVVTLLVCIAAVFVCNDDTTAVYADSDTYTDVLTDLQSDESFNVSDYPADSSDYSLSVKQIAESEDGELFIYVYQPYTESTYDLTATSINISKTIGEDNLNYKNYSLTLLSKSDTLCKYVVDSFTVSSATVRYYDISSIYRAYYTDIDGDETGGNTTSELAIAVAQCWAVGEVNGETYYDMEETKVVTVSSYAGYVRYYTGMPFQWNVYTNNYIDSHFIAFSCDYDIEELYEADISFYLQSYEYNSTQGFLTDKESYTYGDIDTTYYDTPLTISSGNSVSYENVGYLGIFNKTTYSWDRICTLSEFLEDLESDGGSYDSDFIDSISDKQWVLRFYETEFSYSSSENEYGYVYTTITGTFVTDVTILRLKFLCEGKVYNLGVVSNKVTEDVNPDVVINGTVGNCAGVSWTTILSILLLLLLLIVCAPILPYIAKFIVWVISLPFKLISEIYKAIKKKANKNKRE